MYLLASWAESLALFAPKKMKIFLLVTLNALKQAYPIWLAHWWWLLIVIAIMDYQVPGFYQAAGLTEFITALLVFSVCVSTRPSVTHKNFQYFTGMLVYFLPFFLGFVGIACAAMLSVGLSISMIPVGIIYAFFTLDSDGGLLSSGRCVWRALVMVVYNLPLSLACAVLIYGVGRAMLTYMPFSAVALLAPVPVVLLSTLYIKRLHEQFSLYYAVKKVQS